MFGSENFVTQLTFQKTGGASTKLLATTVDYLVWYAKSLEQVKFRTLYLSREMGETTLDRYDQLLTDTGAVRRLTPEEISGRAPLPQGKRYQLKRALRAEIDEDAWSALYSTVSRPFDPPSSGKIAVKVINHYDDEVLKVYEV